MNEFAEIFDLSQSYLWTFALVFCRVGAMMSLFPVFGEQSIPLRVRLGLGFAFTLLTMPIATEVVAITFAVVLSEVLIGLFFGALLRLFVLCLQVAGTIAAQSTSLSQIFGGNNSVDPQPAIGHFLFVAGLCLAATLMMHIRLVEYILISYQIFPTFSVLDAFMVLTVGVDLISKLFSLAFQIAAPFVIASLLYNVILGVINRAMPQLMVAFVGAPAISGGGILLLFAASSLMLAVWVEALNEFLANAAL